MNNPNTSSPCVSVIIPVYNLENYLDACLASVERQTYPSFEALVVDDGSTDQSGRLCEEYAQRDKRIRVIHQANAGVSAARNAGIETAEGEFLLFTDSDDYVEADCLEKMSRFQQEAGADLVLCGYHHLYDGADIQKVPKPAGVYRFSDHPEEFLRLYEQGFLNMPWNKQNKKETHRGSIKNYLLLRLHFFCIGHHLFPFSHLSVERAYIGF